jgi:hypothetical protein
LQLAADLKEARDADRSLVRRLLTHERAETIIAGLLRRHLDAQSGAAPLKAVTAPADDPVRIARRRRRLTREEVPPTAPPASRPTAQERGPRRASSVEARPARRSAAEDAPSAEARPARHSAAEDAPVAEARPARRNAEEDAPVAEGRRSRTRRRDTRGRDAEESFTSEGISYQVRSIADGDVVADSDAASTNGNASTPTGDHWDGPVDEVFINVGRDDGARAEDVEDVLGGSEVPAGDIAYVRVRQRHTFIGVRKGLLEQVVTALNGQRIADREVEAQPARPRPARRQS